LITHYSLLITHYSLLTSAPLPLCSLAPKIMTNQFQWLNALSTRPSLEAAVTEVVDRIKQSLSASVDLGIVFASSAFASDYPRLIPLILEQFPMPVLIGCSGAGIVGMNAEGQPMESEGNVALSLSVASLPGVEVHPFRIFSKELPDPDSPPDAWIDLVGVDPEKQPHFILLVEPFSSKINELLAGLDFAYSGSVKIGGLASVSSMMAQPSLFYHANNFAEDYLNSEGIVGVALSGNILVDAIVAQGCRPIGGIYQIDRSERNIISSLTNVGQTSTSCVPLDLLRDLVNSLSEADRKLVETSLFVGVARDEFKLQLGQGDFLIRNLLGVDPNTGAIAIGDRIRPGQRIQFHLRDADASAQDLEILLQKYQLQERKSAAGALMFSCLGRGKGLYNQPNFDSKLFCRYVNNTSVSGFFGNGEIGPVGSSTFLHGYTSAFGIFRSKD
jgi:small ligand-binding sensory domain FIST